MSAKNDMRVMNAQNRADGETDVALYQINKLLCGFWAGQKHSNTLDQMAQGSAKERECRFAGATQPTHSKVDSATPAQRLVSNVEVRQLGGASGGAHCFRPSWIELLTRVFWFKITREYPVQSLWILRLSQNRAIGLQRRTILIEASRSLEESLTCLVPINIIWDPID